MNAAQVEQFFEQVQPEVINSYVDYWQSIRPVTVDDYFRRYLFAFCSVHTTWEGNVRGYNAIKDLGWLDSKEELRNRLRESRCGMFNNRADYIWEFKETFYNNPAFFCIATGNWQEYRNFLVDKIKGLGMAKVSFTLEMCFPKEAQVTCIDTHIVQLYGLPKNGFKSKKEVALYEQAENHWLGLSKSVNAPPTVARAIYWDTKQKKTNSRYWTYVLEN